MDHYNGPAGDNLAAVQQRLEDVRSVMVRACRRVRLWVSGCVCGCLGVGDGDGACAVGLVWSGLAWFWSGVCGGRVVWGLGWGRGWVYRVCLNGSRVDGHSFIHPPHIHPHVHNNKTHHTKTGTER